ncbi:MAG: shikimate dehydrogenase [Zoogloeaceae bacterium]|jgi:shikimate dehydrogenase|nr:shikimate dehydrogenase [Zoogloeaceae bacterium]
MPITRQLIIECGAQSAHGELPSPDRYAVFGNPVAHSKSPRIHAAFARATGENLCYESRLAPLDGFVEAVRQFILEGEGCAKGANVTVPFKEDAFRLADELTPRARAAGAVNTLCFHEGRIWGDNTDGAGLARDIAGNLAFFAADRRILLLGAGGAARGVVESLLALSPAALVIANRGTDKAKALAAAFAGGALAPRGMGLAALAEEPAFDLVINATSASLAGEALPLPAGIFAAGSLAYDLMYDKGETPFLAQAREDGAARLADGLGMLVEQAAESFFLWRGKRPEAAVRAALMRQLRAT